MTSTSTAFGVLAAQEFHNGGRLGIECCVVPLCPVCQKQGELLHGELVDLLWDVPGKWGIRNCTDCGFAWSDPQPLAHDIAKLYSNYFTHSANASSTFISRLRQAISDCVLHRLGYTVERPKGILPRLLSCGRFAKRAASMDVLDLSAAEMGSLLDVGCGNGDFIARMRSLGWKVTGVEPDAAAAAVGRERGLEIIAGAITDVPVGCQYDVVALNHVIEHVGDPVDLLRECARRLRPHTGRIIITTPNLKSLGHSWLERFWLGLDVPRHLILFSPEGLRKCVLRAGLVAQKLSTETRMARFYYCLGGYAKMGQRKLGTEVRPKVRIKIEGHVFQLIENFVSRYKKNAGEEIFCACTVPTETASPSGMS
jgi:2-polyprenyl-3-methyl-5-hydroxy-6-metoxy-1,4-benzoquinol methylase